MLVNNYIKYFQSIDYTADLWYNAMLVKFRLYTEDIHYEVDIT